MAQEICRELDKLYALEGNLDAIAGAPTDSTLIEKHAPEIFEHLPLAYSESTLILPRADRCVVAEGFFQYLCEYDMDSRSAARAVFDRTRRELLSCLGADWPIERREAYEYDGVRTWPYGRGDTAIVLTMGERNGWYVAIYVADFVQ